MTRLTTRLPAAIAASSLVLCSPLLGAAQASADTAPQAVDRHAVVLVDFRNLALADAKTAHDNAVRNFFGTTGSLASYYAQMSDKHLSVVPAKGDGVLGPFTLDLDDTAACDTGKIEQAARQAVADVAYDHISIVMNTNYCADWWGLGTVPGPVTWFHEGAMADEAAILHEFGHNLGLSHQERQQCTAGSFTTCTTDGYSERSPMGGGGEKKGLSAPELISQKWLTPAQTATPSTTTTVHLTPLHATGTTGVRAIDLPLGTTGDRIVVEFRTPDPATADIDTARGVDVYRIPQGNYTRSVMISNAKHDDPAATGSFTPGTALHDASANLTLSVSNVSANGADVHVQLGPSTAPSQHPQPTTPTGSATATRTPNHPAPANTSAQPDSRAVIAPSATTAPPSTGPAQTQGHTLASTGVKIGTPLAVGGALIAAGAGALTLLRRRTPRHRKH